MKPIVDSDIYISISKEELSELPQAQYEGKVIVIDNDYKMASAIQELRKQKIIGFDTETRPSFRKGMLNKVSLVQLSVDQVCFLFRLNKLNNLRPIFELLEDKDIIKVGLSIRDDFHNLRRISEFSPENFVDLQTLVKDYNITDASLSKIYAILFSKRISKNQRLTNWEADELTSAQENYAALDAQACLDIYHILKTENLDLNQSPYIKHREAENIQTDENTQI